MNLRSGEFERAVKSRYEAVAVDLDDTLLRSDGSLSPYSAAVLAAVVAQGTRLVYVTARHLNALREAVGQLSLAADAICCVGAVAYALGNGKKLTETTLSVEAAQTIVARIYEAVPQANVGWVIGPEMFPGEPDSASFSVLHGSADRPESPVSKICVVATRPNLLGFHEMVAGAVDRVGQIGRTAEGVAEIVAPGVDKGIGLQKWCDIRQIAAARVVAFGDSAADIPMLRRAGRGVAVGNADPETLAAADEAIGFGDQDAVAGWLRMVLLPADWDRRDGNECSRYITGRRTP
jgi:Cof subfamily protein (haloacid dehalogenase superfamily)